MLHSNIQYSLVLVLALLIAFTFADEDLTLSKEQKVRKFDDAAYSDNDFSVKIGKDYYYYYNYYDSSSSSDSSDSSDSSHGFYYADHIYLIDKNTGECVLLSYTTGGHEVDASTIYIRSQNHRISTDKIIGFDFHYYFIDSTSGYYLTVYPTSQTSISLYTPDYSFNCADLPNGCWFPKEGTYTLINRDNYSRFKYTICYSCTNDLLETSEFKNILISTSHTTSFSFPSHQAAESCKIRSVSLRLGSNTLDTTSIQDTSSYANHQYTWALRFTTSPTSDKCASSTITSKSYKICFLNYPPKPDIIKNTKIVYSNQIDDDYYYLVDSPFNFVISILSSPCSTFSITRSSVAECTDEHGTSTPYTADSVSPTTSITVEVKNTLHCTQTHKFKANALLDNYFFDELIGDQVTHHFYFSKFSVGLPYADSIDTNTIRIPAETWGGNYIDNAEFFLPLANYSDCNLVAGNKYMISYDTKRYFSIKCSSDAILNISLSLSYNSYEKCSEFFNIYFIYNNKKSCGFTLPSISNIRLIKVNSTSTLTWDSTSWGSSCSNVNCYYILTQHAKHSDVPYVTNISFFENQTSIINDLENVSIKAQCDYNGKSYSSEPVSTTITDSCTSKIPSISSITCVNCLFYDDKYFAYRYDPIFQFTITDLGYNCEDYSDILIFSFYDYQNSFSVYSKQYSITVPITVSSVYEQNPNDNSKNSLKIRSYPIDHALSLFYKCVVPEMDDIRNVYPNSTYIHYKEISFLLINFSNARYLYSPCFGHNSTYELVYWSDDEPNHVYDSSNSYKQVDLKNNDELVFNWNISSLLVSHYYYQIIGINVLNERKASNISSLYICAKIEDGTPPVPFKPNNGDSNVTVKNLRLYWNSTRATRNLRCSSSDSLKIIIELEDEFEYDSLLGPQLSVSNLGSSASYALIRGTLLHLSTQYYWRVTYLHTNGNKDTETMFSSPVYTFTTVAKHCAYVKCNNGICIPSSVTCDCFSGYHGDFCEVAGLTSQAIGIIVGITCFALISVLIVAFLLLRKKYFFFGLKIPDMSLYMFTMPKRINEDDDPAKPLEDLLELIKDDCNNGFSHAISLLECTPVTDSDSICRALLYCFEKEGKGLAFLIQLIEYEVEHSDSTTTLFRNNSFATKCFKVYGRMIGLPYLFQVVFPLLNKLYKEQQNESIEVRGIEQDSYTTSNPASNTTTYELNLTEDNNDIAYDAAIEENALLIQVACEAFFTSLKKTMNHCPNEFKLICKTIETNVLHKFPKASIEVCLASFLFLRFFVAGITVPESFGILSERPDLLMRRRLILIAKVLSNMSTQVKFGDKEDYMVVMNDYLASRHSLLKAYYNFVLNYTNDTNQPVSVPDKYYNASLSVLSYAFVKQESGEWDKDLDEEDDPFSVYIPNKKKVANK